MREPLLQRLQSQAVVCDGRGRTDQPARQPIQRLGALGMLTPPAALQVGGMGRDLREPFGAWPGRHLGGGRRRRRPEVCGKIGNRHIGLVSDAADDRHRRSDDGTRDRFVIEGPQILYAPASAAHQEHLALATLASQGNRRRDPFTRTCSLYRGRIDDHAAMRRAPLQGAQDIVQGGRLRTGDDADAGRECRHLTFCQRIEQSFGGQLRFQFQECLVQVADASPANRFNPELVIAARRIQRHQCAYLDLVTFARQEVRVLGAAAEHDRTDLRRIVLEREIPVARCRLGEIGDLARHPSQRKAAFQQPRDRLVQR